MARFHQSVKYPPKAYVNSLLIGVGCADVPFGAQDCNLYRLPDETDRPDMRRHRTRTARLGGDCSSCQARALFLAYNAYSPSPTGSKIAQTNLSDRPAQLT